ncbi:uncharacterized protein LOC104583783 isoform X1 [Brachypodium distachyon]|uniref:uncharacterized protein LOC104583783 isoform X1 n=1 Tax=Brachypodium distachyon TaxID=15368 RepID=UPI000D0D95F9|nr:uncharacterized protein LOC104583783 isoform X1 [Brachypodium distachyon]|eukprot:XP_024316779.1 uncharacterized protein LOC104583783 isoform X1 [Brachypodium distachyon]
MHGFTGRYKIYIEGSAWSISDKYILACDSMTLVIYYDFFSRVLMPTKHYWPVRDDSKCSSINCCSSLDGVVKDGSWLPSCEFSTEPLQEDIANVQGHLWTLQS